MVWIHGGNNCAGTAATYPYLRNFAADHGVLVISVNYRLGLFGWFYHPALHDGESTQEDRSGNFGTLDLIAALRWVQANVAAFGGDPENVTIFGESAGGINVYSLIASPLAKGLFHKAIVQSGFPASFSLTEAFNFTEDPDPGYPGSALETVTELMIRDGIVPSRVDAKAVLLNRGREWTEQYLRKKSVKELLAPYKAVQLGMYNGPRIFRDGFVMPHETFTELGKQTPPRYNNVPVILGSNRDEFKLFMSQDPAFVRMFLGFIPRIRNQAAYRFAGRHASDAWKAVGVDEPARLLRAAQNSPVFAYRWDWDEEPNLCIVDLSILLGAGHGLEIPMLFNNFDLGLLRLLYARADLGGLRELAAAMGSYWTQFARAGSPGRGNDGMLPDWRPWDEGGRMRESLLILDTRNDGGIRMSCESVSLEGVLKSLAKEAKPGGCLDKRSQVGVAKLLQLFEQQFANAPLVSYTTSQKIC
jgi:para-nitrobenzyl esterase